MTYNSYNYSNFQMPLPLRQQKIIQKVKVMPVVFYNLGRNKIMNSQTIYFLAVDKNVLFHIEDLFRMYVSLTGCLQISK